MRCLLLTDVIVLLPTTTAEQTTDSPPALRKVLERHAWDTKYMSCSQTCKSQLIALTWHSGHDLSSPKPVMVTRGEDPQGDIGELLLRLLLLRCGSGSDTLNYTPKANSMNATLRASLCKMSVPGDTSKCGYLNWCTWLWGRWWFCFQSDCIFIFNLI